MKYEDQITSILPSFIPLCVVPGDPFGDGWLLGTENSLGKAGPCFIIYFRILTTAFNLSLEFWM